MIITVHHTDTLLGILKKEFPGASNTRIRQMINIGSIRINGKQITNSSRKVQSGDQVEYCKVRSPRQKKKSPFTILYEDRDILVTVKPGGLLTYGERGTGGTSVYRMLTGWLRERSGGKEKLYVVHRLDRDVSGVMVFAKNRQAQELIKQNWPQATKKYYALVEGRPPERQGTFRSYLAEAKNLRVYSVSHPEGARLAVTHYRTLKELPRHTLLEVTLETGRKHQIRVHLSEAGCPVAGDTRYGARNLLSKKIRLEAFYLAFSHPRSQERLEFCQPLSNGFLEAEELKEK